MANKPMLSVERELLEALHGENQVARIKAFNELRALLDKPAPLPVPMVCNHEWTDDGEYLLVCTACGAQEDHNPGWRDMSTAPRDGTMLRLLVEFEEHSTEDADQAPTIGANNFDNDEVDEWKFPGWCWTHDHFVEGKGVPVGWLPMLDEPKINPVAEQAAPVAVVMSDLSAVQMDHNRLVRELDVLLNGEAGAAKQASLCDIVAQVRLKRDLLITSLNQGAPADLQFPTMLRKMWSGGEVQQWIEAQGPLYRKAPVLSGANAALQRVYDVIGLDYSHDVSVLIENFKNIKRFADYLHAIEREFFMVPGDPSDEPEDAGSKPDDECLMNCWGSTQEQYVEQFRSALAYLASKAEPAGAGVRE